ncbi:MAG TPA: c-type cytochrome [Opitutaceae bacterium]|nr:c-type cytochrome [Opitutaceae bacterium]
MLSPLTTRWRPTSALVVALGFATFARAALPAPDADDGGLTLPPGFRALVVADHVTAPREALRFITVAPNGDIYVKSSREGIYALRDTNGDGRADEIKHFGTGNGTGIALHDGWLYYSTTTGVYRYKYTPGQLVPTGEPETIVTGLPDGHQHNAKAFAFDGEGRLLVEVGSPFNVYSKPDRQLGAKGMDATEFLKTHGGYWRFDPNKQNQTLADGYHYSTGHRHSLSIAWNPVSHLFFMVMMGRDQLNTVDPQDYDALDNAERVAEEMHVLRPGVNLGWPYTYWDPIKQARMVAPEFGGDNRKRDNNPAYDKPVIAFPAHWAPLQMCYASGTQFPAKYRGGMFIAFHGSWNRAPRPQAGYKIVYVPFDAQGRPTRAYETFADGFAGSDYFTNTNDARYRPSGVAVGPDGSLYVSETERGRVWRIIYTGESAPAGRATLQAAATAPQTYPPIDANTPGGRIYATVCAACHMPSGSGVANMQPPLVGSKVVAGDAGTLIQVLLKGPAAVLPANREHYENVMPPFGSAYSDADIASVINYLRANFAPSAPHVTPEQVKAERGE